jgi:hypothetical protein
MREYDIPPNFIKDLQHGEQGEQIIRNFLHDTNSGAIEIKTDRYRNGRLAIETDQNPRNQGWKKSGINITTAKWWVYQYHLDGAFLIIKTERIKRYLRTHPDRYNEKTKQNFAPKSDNPAKGFLLEQHEVTDMILNPKYDQPQ